MSPEHGHLAGVILEPQCLAGDKPLQYAEYHFGLVLLVGEEQTAQFPVDCPAAGAPQAAHGNSGGLPPFRPYQSGHAVVVFQPSAAPGTGGALVHHHIQPSNLNQKYCVGICLTIRTLIIYD